MTKGKQHHLVPQGDNWAVERSGSKRASGVFETKKQAEEAGREISRNQGTEFVIHKKNGKIQRSDSHGNDPNPPKDKD
jgi:hypothetical protein